MTAHDRGAVARSIIDTNLYMVLATADEAGRPWASPVYFANAGYAEFFWVSSPDATHSRNIAMRPQISIVIFDSQVPIGTGQAVYMPAVAEEVASGELEGKSVTEIGAVLTGNVAGRASDEETTLFDSTGLAIQDLAIAIAVLAAWRDGRVSAQEIAL